MIDEFNDRLKEVFDTDNLQGILHVAYSAFESVRAEEPKGSERYMKLNNGIDRLLEWLSVLDPEEWPDAAIKAADKLGQEFEKRIADVFGNQNKPEGIQA